MRPHCDWGQRFKPVVVQKNHELELSGILDKLFHTCLKESCFSDCWKVSAMVYVFRNVGEMSTAPNVKVS